MSLLHTSQPGTPVDVAPRPARAPGLTPWQRVLFFLILGYGIFLRSYGLSVVPFRVDEAESSLNALTIFQHGVPEGHYLGLPIFENTLILRDPTSKEFEFKDSSYSDRDLAIYHGWLPLYSIAASYALFGIHPDTDASNLHVLHSPEDLRFRTIVGRLPAVGFGIVFMLALYFAGKSMYGQDAAWAALTIAAFCSPAIEAARQARYYSALLAVSALGAWALWRLVKHDRYRDFALMGVVLILAFFTHLISFVIMCGALVLLIPVIRFHPRWFRKALLLEGILLSVTVPWILLTHFVQSAHSIPGVITQFQWPGDLLTYPHRELPYTLVALTVLATLLLVRTFRDRLPGAITTPATAAARPLCFLAAWAFVGYLVFIFGMPAASYFFQRMTMTLLAPALLFGAIAFAAAGRVLAPRVAGAFAAVIFVAFMYACNGASFYGFNLPSDGPRSYLLVDQIRSMNIAPGTRLFATPNDHLILTFYTGIPVADVAAVRKSFLDTFPGRMLIFEFGPGYYQLSNSELHDVARRRAYPMSETQFKWVEDHQYVYLVQKYLRGHVATISPSQPEHTDWLNMFSDAQYEKTRWVIAFIMDRDGCLMFRGFEVKDWRDWWQVFFYRFSDPDARRREHVNFADRVRSAHATILPITYIVLYDCPPLAPASPGPVHTP